MFNYMHKIGSSHDIPETATVSVPYMGCSLLLIHECSSPPPYTKYDQYHQ